MMIDKEYWIDLQFFNAEDEGRTEKATGKKRSDSRKKGQVAKSTELNTAVILITFFSLMTVIGGYYLQQIELYLLFIYNKIPELVQQDEASTFFEIIGSAFLKIIFINGPLWIVLFIMALVISLLQVGYKPTFQPMAPKFSKMNPISGLKRIVSKDMIVQLIISMGKVIILGYIFISIIKDEIPVFLNFHMMSITQILFYVGDVVVKIGFYVGGAFLFLAVFDYAYQKYKFEEGIKMTKEDVKEEYKQSEGDPQIKGKIKQKMKEMSLKRMMQAIPNADVIITNPTHFAVAISYKSDQSIAPIVTAKGVDYLAKKIKEKAKEHHIHIVENKPLARALYYTVDLDKEIPPELYNAVAEVLAFVYSLENKKY